MADNCLFIKKGFLEKASKSLKTFSTIREADIEDALYILAEKDKDIMENSDETIISRLKDYFKFNVVYAETKKEYNDVYDTKELYFTTDRTLDSLIDTRHKVVESLGEKLAEKYVGPIYYDASDGLYHFEIANAMPNYKTTPKQESISVFNKGYVTEEDLEDGKVFFGFPKEVEHIYYTTEVILPTIIFRGKNGELYGLVEDRNSSFGYTLCIVENGRLLPDPTDNPLSISKKDRYKKAREALERFTPKEYRELITRFIKGSISDVTEGVLENFGIPLIYPTFRDKEGNVVHPLEVRLPGNHGEPFSIGELNEVLKEKGFIQASPLAIDQSQESISEFTWAATSDNGFEVSSKGDSFGKQFSAFNAKFKAGTKIDGVAVGGKSIEWVYQNVIKKSAKGAPPASNSKLYNPNLKTKEEREDFSYYEGYLPLWQEWAKQNPERIEELREKAKGKTLTDQFANTRVNQARALSDILNSTNRQSSKRKIVNPEFFHHVGDFRSKYARQLKEIEKAGHIVNIRPLTKKESEDPGALGADAVIEFSNGKSIQISFSVGSLDLGNTKQARDFYKSIGKLIKNPYYEKDNSLIEWVVDIKAVTSYFFPLSNLAYEYFVNNPEKLQALNITGNPLSSLNKELRGGSYDANKDDFAKGFVSPFIEEDTASTPSADTNKKISVSTKGYRKGDPQKNPNIDYVFTDNAEAYIGATKAKVPVKVKFPNPNSPKLNVSDVKGTNQAGIRTDQGGNLSKNAYGIVVKKYQQGANGRFVAKEGQFQDTDDDFRLFTSLNEHMFDRLSRSSNTEVIFPSQMGLGKAALPKRFAEWLQRELYNRFGLDTVIEENTKSNYDGYGLRVNSESESKEQSKAIISNPKLDAAMAVIEKVKEDAKEHVEFDKKTHTYYIDGKKADWSVTEFLHGGKSSISEAWSAISSRLGNTLDRFVRAYFSGKSVDGIPNLSKKDKENLIEDLERLRRAFDNKYGKGKYRIITDEIPIYGNFHYTDIKGKSAQAVIAGTPDMIIVDSDGNYHIYDMKTRRTNGNYKWQDKTLQGYYEQLNMYKSILEARYPEMRGKIKDLALIKFGVKYPIPQGERGSVGEYDYVTEGEPEDIDTVFYSELDREDYDNIEDRKDYQAPRLLIEEVENGLFDVPVIDLEGSFEQLSEEEKEIIKEELGNPRSETGSAELSVIDKQARALYNPGALPASERLFLANSAMYYTSFIITQLQNNPDANKVYFGDMFSDYNFTEMSREEIINTVKIGRILYYVKERYFNTANRQDIDDFDTLDKLDLAYNNFGALIQSAYSKLITLERTTVIDTAPDEVKREDLDLDMDDFAEGATLEEKDQEYWRQGQRNISARASLSVEIRRVFERLPIVDNDGNYILDKYGYGLMTFVDSGEAMNRIFEWVQDCTTMEEMESILEEHANEYPWLNNILDKIQEEPFRSQFYQNFRKQHIKYGIVTVEYDKEGRRVYSTKVINTKGASQGLLDDVVEAYNSGALTDIIIPIKGDLEGKGRVNVSKVERLLDDVENIKNLFNKTSIDRIVNLNTDNIVKVLTTLGIHVDSKVLREAFAKDVNAKNFNRTNIWKILDKAGYILKEILEADEEGNTEYNPMEKGGDHNVYNEYKTIIGILSNYVQDSIEASTYEGGKMYYSYITPSYMGKLVSNFTDALKDSKKFENFIRDNYSSYRFFKDGETWNNVWLEQLATSSEAREKFDYKAQLTFDGTPYVDLSELSYTLSLMNEYFYDKGTNRGNKLAWYRIPILANKPSSEFIRFTRYTGRGYKRSITEGMKKVLNQEIMRIRTVLERALNNNIQMIGVKDKVTFDIDKNKLDSGTRKRIKDGELTSKDLKSGLFTKSGASFKFLCAFNAEIANNTEFGKLLIAKINGKKVNEARFNNLFEEALNGYMDARVQTEIKHWKNIGLYDTETKIISTKEGKKKVTAYKYVSNLGNSEEAINDALEEYVWNDMFATINIIELTATDLAYYRNMEDFQKRYSQIHAPAMRLNITAVDAKGNLYSTDGMERTMYLKDSIKTSEVVKNVEIALNHQMTKLSGREKEHFTMLKDLILSSFDDINVADAQAYSSPTSFRKKLGMMGRWTDEMEEAYDRIISGDYNVMDLAIMLQPMKPFVYSQIRKSSGAKTMSDLKVPVQNKNSEYMLFLSNALMRGDKQTNKLIAIYDFMEDSAYDGRIAKYGKVIARGTYNGKGIDTIQFQSAVNSGSLGAIDIDSLNTYEEVKAALENAAYYNSDKSESSDNNMDRYNDQFVHTIPFEDYGLQQETPAHLIDHEQLMGSQVRILSISDITPGTSFEINGETLTDTELKKEYMNLIAENIRDSFDQLIEDFKLNGTKLEKNAAISELLKEAILKDQRYGADLLRACSLNEDGDFVIPLNDPIQSIRIQQLLNSIIKSRINKQKVKGGPVVQASVFGMSDDLHIVWDEKNPGKIKYFECYMPVPSAELEEALTRYDSEGHAYIMSMDEAVKEGIITEDMRKVIGYRIPTEDKYSMAPLYIKDFLPKAAGEAIMMPKEITKLAGSDFDIDKMYIMLKAFTSKTTTDWKAFKRDIMNSESVKGAINRSKEADKKNNTNSKLKGKISERVDMAINRIVNGQEFGKEEPFEQAIKDYYNKNKDKYTKSKMELSTRKRDARNNRIFDLQWAVLTSEDTVSKMFNPGSFDIQKRTARISIILENLRNRYTYSYLSKLSLNELDDIVDNEVTGSGRNIIFPTTQTYFHKQNMTAGKLIGIFANNNTSHAFLQMQDIRLNVGDTGFMFDGVKVDSNQNNKLDALYGKDGSLISKTIAGFLAASVDAVKDPVLNFMNLNTFTANTAMLLVRLGFDSDSVGLFLNQPIIKYVTDEYFKRSNEKYTTVNEVVNDTLYKYLNLDSEEVNGIVKALASTPFRKEDLAEQLGGRDNTDFQASVLVLFRRLAEMAQDLNTLTFLTKFNSVTNAPGPTIADNLVMIDRYKGFLDKMKSENPPFNTEAGAVIDNNPILKAIYDTTLGERGASKLLFGDYFPHFTSTFINILNRFRQNLKGQLDSKTINKIVGDFLFYKMTLGENPVIDASEENRNKFINEFTKVYGKESSDVENNDLLQVIKIKSRNRRCPVPTLEAKTGNYSIDIQERVKSAWSDLILNPNTRDLANDLFFYNIFRSGFTFSPKSFGHLASVDVRLEIPGYIETLRDVEFNDDDVSIDDFMYMFLRNHSNEYKLVPRLEDSDGVTIDESTSKTTKKKELNIEYGKRYDKVDSIIVERGLYDITYAPVIMYNDTLYMLKKGGKGYVTYSETTPLGNPNNFLEYSPEGANTETVIKDNKTKKSPTSSRKSTSKSYNRMPSKDTTDEVESKKVMTDKDIEDFFSSVSTENWKEIQANINSNSDIDRLVTNALNQIVTAGRSVERSRIENFVKDKLKSIRNKIC